MQLLHVVGHASGTPGVLVTACAGQLQLRLHSCIGCMQAARSRVAAYNPDITIPMSFRTPPNAQSHRMFLWQVREYVGQLEVHLSEAHKQASRLIRRQTALAAALADFGNSMVRSRYTVLHACCRAAPCRKPFCTSTGLSGITCRACV